MNATDRVALLRHAYRLFNDRRIDELLALMSDDVEWPDVPNGTTLHGQQAIRSYWEGQFAVADPRVHPVDFIEIGDEVVAVVHQRVLDLDGRPLSPSAVVFHRYGFEGGRVRRMVVFADRDAAVA